MIMDGSLSRVSILVCHVLMLAHKAAIEGEQESVKRVGKIEPTAMHRIWLVAQRCNSWVGQSISFKCKLISLIQLNTETTKMFRLRAGTWGCFKFEETRSNECLKGRHICQPSSFFRIDLGWPRFPCHPTRHPLYPSPMHPSMSIDMHQHT